DPGQPACRNLSQMPLETLTERLIQRVYILGEDIAATILRSGIMGFRSEELHLDSSAPHRTVGVGALLVEGDLEAQSAVEVHDLVNRPALQKRDHSLGHTFCPPPPVFPCAESRVSRQGLYDRPPRRVTGGRARRPRTPGSGARRRRRTRRTHRPA